MVASWYGEQFHGRQTASGERYDMEAMTAAHRTLPFGTVLKVTRPSNGRTVTVTINDRGPFIKGRDLDLSKGAARKLDMLKDGVASVYVTQVGRNDRYIRRVNESGVTNSPYTVQVGSFSNRGNAQRFLEQVSFTHSAAYIDSAQVNGRTLYRVRVGSFQTRQSAENFANKMASEGYRPLVTSRQLSPR